MQGVLGSKITIMVRTTPMVTRAKGTRDAPLMKIRSVLLLQENVPYTSKVFYRFEIICVGCFPDRGWSLSGSEFASP